ncbi:hypothetical protein [Spirosoma endophyticum]|uniref:Uncharacterized protein n=1 Tax=Spirosoma endophyticum TaxID=662367 RepID=A0A1I1MJG6_9BACT|nr:hypothetical protein [Spirosoma endophyticum]SFC85547.1 hypothetical protein SAMN05216167_102600 [Spirosoma endophyticum]
MVSQQERIFKVSHKALRLKWLMLLLLFASTIFVPFMIATSGQEYPDLSVAPIFWAAFGFIWVPLLVAYWRQTIRIELAGNHFTIKKLWQSPKQFDYKAILAHNERLEVDRGGTFSVLTVYLQTNYLSIDSNEFEEYDLLKESFGQYGKSIAYQKVLTLAERNRLRWMIAGLALFIAANITFGYVAHNPANPKPARLVPVTDIVDKIIEEQPKGRLKGVMISLRTHPAFSFYVSRRNYDVRLDTLKWAITTQKPIELLIRESDYRKKLIKTEPLTVGDKYDNYKQILVFGVSQDGAVHIKTSKPVVEPIHTNPGQRTFLLSVLLLFCWTGWAYVDRHKVLRAN